MSGEILFDVMNCDGFGKPAMKLLLIALADRADETGVCWPSRCDLKLRTTMSDSQITRTLQALVAGKWIQRQQRRDASTLFRLNLVKIRRCAAQCKADRKAAKLGREWEPFPEEVAQAIENNGDDQIGHTHDQGGQTHDQIGQTHDQGGHLTSQEPLKNLKGPAALSIDLEKVGRVARSQILAGRSAFVGGVVLKPGSPQHVAVSDLLRNGASE